MVDFIDVGEERRRLQHGFWHFSSVQLSEFVLQVDD
jgi:hypothetical protein